MEFISSSPVLCPCSELSSSMWVFKDTEFLTAACCDCFLPCVVKFSFTFQHSWSHTRFFELLQGFLIPFMVLGGVFSSVIISFSLQTCLIGRKATTSTANFLGTCKTSGWQRGWPTSCNFKHLLTGVASLSSCSLPFSLQPELLSLPVYEAVSIFCFPEFML